VSPAVAVRLATLAEELGYRSWWVGEHVVVPSPFEDPDDILEHHADLAR
jgi:alkanesulfonate monooxygenase SsuD/methylene tetrahydromethanopterin reductase-like flavin-dependent oxidoreductase (luciferase family)